MCRQIADCEVSYMLWFWNISCHFEICFLVWPRGIEYLKWNVEEFWYLILSMWNLRWLKWIYGMLVWLNCWENITNLKGRSFGLYMLKLFLIYMYLWEFWIYDSCMCCLRMLATISTDLFFSWAFTDMNILQTCMNMNIHNPEFWLLKVYIYIYTLKKIEYSSNKYCQE